LACKISFFNLSLSLDKLKYQIRVILFKNRRYILDKTDLQFKQVRLSFKDKALRSLLWFALSGVLTIIYAGIFNSFFGSPKEKLLNQKLENIKLNYSLVALQLDNSMSVLNDLRLSDDILYRPILDMDSVPETYRRVGVGGVDRYRNLTGFMNSNMLISYMSKLDMVSNMVNVQRESFKSVTDRASEWKTKLENMPMISPVDVQFQIVDFFRYRESHPVLGTPSMHNGLDFRAPVGTAVYATGNGTVYETGRNWGHGNYVIIDHGFGTRTLYGHLSRISVSEERQVKRGDLIGLVGSTGLSSGSHLHYEITRFGRYENPINFFNNDMTTEEYNEMIKAFASRYRLR